MSCGKRCLRFIKNSIDCMTFHYCQQGDDNTPIVEHPNSLPAALHRILPKCKRIVNSQALMLYNIECI